MNENIKENYNDFLKNLEGKNDKMETNLKGNVLEVTFDEQSNIKKLAIVVSEDTSQYLVSLTVSPNRYDPLTKSYAVDEQKAKFLDEKLTDSFNVTFATLEELTGTEIEFWEYNIDNNLVYSLYQYNQFNLFQEKFIKDYKEYKVKKIYTGEIVAVKFNPNNGISLAIKCDATGDFLRKNYSYGTWVDADKVYIPNRQLCIKRQNQLKEILDDENFKFVNFDESIFKGKKIEFMIVKSSFAYIDVIGIK